jgi:hypothetical protein
VVPRLAEAGMTAPVMRERDGELSLDPPMKSVSIAVDHFGVG